MYMTTSRVDEMASDVFGTQSNRMPLDEINTSSIIDKLYDKGIEKTHQNCATDDQIKITEHYEREESLISDLNPWDQGVFDNMNLEMVNESNEIEEHLQQIIHEHSRCPENVGVDNHTDEETNKELTEEDIEIFLENEELAAKQGNNVQIDTELTPEMGMEFDSSEAAHRFFNFYAYLAGFSVVVAGTYHTQSKKRNNELTRLTLRCNKHGPGNEITNSALRKMGYGE
ncbi:uncharacterized protein LOC133886362 [Phragmites australis]|uniref:uncharacterized protein LOC133886362 n=1 Tax=Phragmites australis TaxID=29695 RepID=UPI002D78CFA0|nr:uncharacterized protein LOC133886362 [Phragmites australis]